jgi:sensor histidine kinase YesM
MDIKHPFSNIRLAIVYGLFWLFVAAILVVTSTVYRGVPLALSLTENIVFVVLFGIIGVAIWYVIKYSTIENNSILRIILAHAIAATIIVALWMYISAVIVKLIIPAVNTPENVTIIDGIYNGYMFYLFNVVFFYAVNYYIAFTEKTKNEARLKELVKEAELHALKSQINPHFLFNSLNSISSLTMTDPAKAQEMVINLSQLMRYSLKHDQNERVTLKQEIENNKLYLSIEKVRFGKKLNPIFDLQEDCLNAEIPNMILQPLYENAIKYGVYEAVEPVDIVTTCRCNTEVLEVTISNTYDTNVISKKGEGIGLRNIRDRLQVIYENPYLLQTENKGTEFIVTLNIPQKK